METPIYFKAGNYNLFGVLHKPGTVDPDVSHPIVDNNKVGFVFCHPFAEEKVISHRVMVNCARGLANSGFHVFRFDFMGHGDSEGSFEDATVDTRLEDIHEAVQFFKSHIGIDKIILLGLRFGATLAALYTNKERITVDSLVMINPIINGNAYFKKILRSNLATQMATYQKILKNREQLIEELLNGIHVNVDGYLISKKLYLQMKDIDLFDIQSHNFDKLLIMDVSKKANAVFDKKYIKLNEKFDMDKCHNEICKVHCEPFWADTKLYIDRVDHLYKEVIEWCRKTYCLS